MQTLFRSMHDAKVNDIAGSSCESTMSNFKPIKELGDSACVPKLVFFLGLVSYLDHELCRYFSQNSFDSIPFFVVLAALFALTSPRGIPLFIKG